MNPEDVKKYGLEEGDWVNVWLLIEEWDLLGRKVKAERAWTEDRLWMV
jgi:anaerobic selenocysteine-containing dehydrogenase